MRESTSKSSTLTLAAFAVDFSARLVAPRLCALKWAGSEPRDRRTESDGIQPRSIVDSVGRTLCHRLRFQPRPVGGGRGWGQSAGVQDSAFDRRSGQPGHRPVELHGTRGPATTSTGLDTPNGLAFDSSGNLWVADSSNNRVLEYKAPFTTGEAASLVLGPA